MVIVLALAIGIAIGIGADRHVRGFGAGQDPWNRVSLRRQHSASQQMQCQHLRYPQQPHGGVEQTPAVLVHVFVMITFHFDVERLAWLAQARAETWC